MGKGNLPGDAWELGIAGVSLPVQTLKVQEGDKVICHATDLFPHGPLLPIANRADPTDAPGHFHCNIAL